MNLDFQDESVDPQDMEPMWYQAEETTHAKANVTVKYVAQKLAGPEGGMTEISRSHTLVPEDAGEVNMVTARISTMSRLHSANGTIHEAQGRYLSKINPAVHGRTHRFSFIFPPFSYTFCTVKPHPFFFSTRPAR